MDALIIEIVKQILATTTEFLVVGAYARDELCRKAKVAAIFQVRAPALQFLLVQQGIHCRLNLVPSYPLQATQAS